MPYVQVDVELSEFETYELVDELAKRTKDWRKSHQLTDKQKDSLREDLLALLEVLKISSMPAIQIKTLDDKMKYEHLLSVWDKYTSSQVENKLP